MGAIVAFTLDHAVDQGGGHIILARHFIHEGPNFCCFAWVKIRFGCANAGHKHHAKGCDHKAAHRSIPPEQAAQGTFDLIAQMIFDGIARIALGGQVKPIARLLFQPSTLFVNAGLGRSF